MDSINNKKNIIAHRGASGHAPENTTASVLKAIEMKADHIEIDVQQSKDGKVVVIHDNSLDRTTNGTGDILNFSCDELKKLDAGSWFDSRFKGEKIPLLEEVAEIVKGKAGLIVEIKNGSEFYPDIEKNVWDTIKRTGLEDNAVISSSRITVLSKIKSIAPEARLGKIITPNELWRSLFQPNSFIFKLGLINHITDLHPHWSFVDKNFIQYAEKHNLNVYPWTVNKERKMRTMINRGVNGIITNYPDIAYKIFS